MKDTMINIPPLSLRGQGLLTYRSTAHTYAYPPGMPMHVPPLPALEDPHVLFPPKPELQTEDSLC